MSLHVSAARLGRAAGRAGYFSSRPVGELRGVDMGGTGVQPGAAGFQISAELSGWALLAAVPFPPATKTRPSLRVAMTG